MARYEFIDGKSSKFWEITLEGNSFTICFGRIGTGGQTQTKTFATPDLAKREHDKLVAEKTKKGYALAGGSASAPAGTPASKSGKSPVKTAEASLRKDLYVYNEATGFLITSKRLFGKGWDSSGKEWEKAVKNGDLIAIELYQDDPFNIRVVVGGDLEPQEAEEWVGRLDWKLRVPDGNLVVCGGSEYVMEENDDEEDSYLKDFIRHVKIPRGDYRATVYMYMNGVNGRPCMQAAKGGDEPEPLGEWFRRTRPNEKFPPWLHNDCVSDPDEDPGHEKEWKTAKQIKDPVEDYIEFLLHLTPLDEGVKVPMPELGDGWFSTPTECRVPERIPLRIAARDIEGHLEKKKEDAGPAFVDVFKFTDEKKHKREPVNGKVEVPLAHLERLYRVAWFCHFYSMPQFFIRPPAGKALPEIPGKVEEVKLSMERDRLFVSFAETGRQTGALRGMSALAALLKDIPDGSELEMDTVFRSDEQLKLPKPQGLHRYKGTIRSGVVIVTEAFPVADAEKLNGALALSAQVETGPMIDAGNEDLAGKIFASLKEHPYFADNPPTKKGTLIGQKKFEAVMLNIIAAEVFTRVYRNVWPCFYFDPEEKNEDDDEEIESLGDALSNGPPKPPRGELVLQGADKRKYYISDASRLDAECQKRIADVEKGVLPLGFKHVADIVCSAMEYALIRAYAQDNGLIWGVVIVVPGGRGAFEFTQFFEKGGGLTTTQNGTVSDQVYRDAYKTVRPNGAIPQMYKDHLRRAEYLSEFLGAARKLDATAKGLAADVELSIINQEKPVSRKPVLLKGDEGRTIYQADARAIDPDAPKLVEAADDLMKKLGFSPIGDVVNSRFSSNVTRGYVNAAGTVMSKYILDASTNNPPAGYWELVTSFAKGVLVSTRYALSKDEPKRRIFRLLDSKNQPEDMLAKHEKRTNELAVKLGEIQKVKADLKGLAEEVEQSIRRLIG